MLFGRSAVLRFLGLATVAAVVACGSGAGDGDAKANPDATKNDGPGPDDSNLDPSVAAQLVEKPWEIISNKGETYLPNVFYADASQNEQIMPYAIDGHTMIDRLIYPTLGNPNLYTKSDPKDELTVVLRIEESVYSFLAAKTSPVQGSQLQRLSLTNNAQTGFAFFLVPRGSRDPNTESSTAISSGNGTGVIRIYPNDAFVSPIPADMPEVLKQRNTVRFVFDQAQMAKAPAGLYDLRFEVRQDDDIVQNAYEYQYNAVRVFDTEPDEYSVINVTDTQVSVGDIYSQYGQTQLDQFVQFVNTTNDDNVRNASFIVFNGDLHNGGSPGGLRQRTVATTYASEAKAIVDDLKYLPVPIFLTIGNHDGYVSTGQVPSAAKAADDVLLDSLEKVVDDVSVKPWPGFNYPDFQSFLDATASADRLGGWHRDLITGGFSRTGAGATFASSWKEVPHDQRNYVLYDGFYQWQKTYGPQYFSWKFGKNTYVSLNSFELRQHRRAGWGMYTVNYGGGMTDTQLAWLDRELLRAKTDGTDVVLLAHHDPRGGHKGLDQGYYFEQLEYESIWQSAINYLVGKVWNSAVCKLPDWALPRDQQTSCVHDGLQEWMRPDPDFDCTWDERTSDGTCDPSLFAPSTGTPTHSYIFSGLELMKRVSQNPQVRTFLLGHTHYNSLEVLKTGDELLPGQLAIGDDAAQKFASLEVENPVRGYAMQQRFFTESAMSRAMRDQADYDGSGLPFLPVATRVKRFGELIDRVLPTIPRVLDAPMGKPRELVILRLVSNADMSTQTYQPTGKSALGFAVLHLMKKDDARGYATPQINKATFFVNTGSNIFDDAKTIDLDRTTTLAAHDAENPIQQMYTW